MPLLRWMTSGVNVLQLVDVYPRVDGGGFELFVSKQLLDISNVRAAFKHVRCAGVTQEVRPAFGAADVGF